MTRIRNANHPQISVPDAISRVAVTASEMRFPDQQHGDHDEDKGPPQPLVDVAELLAVRGD